MIRFSVVVLVAIATVVGCAGEADEHRGVVVRDSAGIRIVENEGASWTSDQAWHLSQEPIAEIGRLDEPAHQLSRVVGATRLADGRIVVGDGGSGELRFFDAFGQYLATAGGKGDGPGEFRFMLYVTRVAGDTLVAGNGFPPGRQAWFTADGTFIDQTARDLTGRLDPERHFSEFALTLPDGSLLMYVNVRSTPLRNPVRRSRFGFIRVSRDGSAQDTLGWFAGMEFMYRGSGAQTTAGPTPFSSKTVIALSTDHILAAETGRYEIRRIRFDGRIDLIIRVTVEPRPVTGADRAAFREEILEFARQQNREPRYQRWLAEIEFPEFKPPLAALVSDAMGNIWVKEEQGPYPNDVWAVFDGEGFLLGRVEMPTDLCEPQCGEPFGGIMEIGSDYVLATLRDEFDVEYVRVYDLIKPGQ